MRTTEMRVRRDRGGHTPTTPHWLVKYLARRDRGPCLAKTTLRVTPPPVPRATIGWGSLATVSRSAIPSAIARCAGHVVA
jgi:hypothetical protein